MSVARSVAEQLERASWIRRMFEEGARLKAERGAGNIFDFTLGNPDVDPPAEVLEALQRLAGLSLVEALAMATRNPARVGRIASRRRGLSPGDRADIVEFRHEPETRGIEILRTFFDGELVYSKH